MKTLAELKQMPTLEVDTRRVHAEPWLLKVNSSTERIWITETGKISRQVWRDGDFHEAPTAPDLRAEDVEALLLLEKQALGGKLTDSELSKLSRYNE